MAAKPPIVFKSEPALWAMLAYVDHGKAYKPFDMRRWELADKRIQRLSWGHFGNKDRMPINASNLNWSSYSNHRWYPDESQVSFLNKGTGELLTFEYLGVEFAPWAPGWGFLILGKRLSPPVEET